MPARRADVARVLVAPAWPGGAAAGRSAGMVVVPSVRSDAQHGAKTVGSQRHPASARGPGRRPGQCRRVAGTSSRWTVGQGAAGRRRYVQPRRSGPARMQRHRQFDPSRPCGGRQVGDAGWSIWSHCRFTSIRPSRHDHDAVGKPERLFLIVRHEDGGRAGLFVDAAQPCSGIMAHRRASRAPKRLVR